jgi:hypothetical protein
VLARRRLVRLVGAVYPLLVSAVVVATGNHYVLDGVAGAAAVAVTARLLTRGRRPSRRTGVAQRPACRVGRRSGAVRRPGRPAVARQRSLGHEPGRVPVPAGGGVDAHLTAREHGDP